MLTLEQVQAKIETSYCVSVRNADGTSIMFDIGCFIEDEGDVELWLRGSSQPCYVDWSFLATDNVTFYKLQEN